MTESAETRRKRLRFRSHHRGTKESDLLFGRFADAHLPAMTDAQLSRYEALLEENDADLWAWLTGQSAPPTAQDHDVFKLLKNFRI
ncbi:MAG: succinate dehydrogenase assembly factor 2 [Alphaproteobacteria bacterium]|nr:succinate dehydrogenase assembly factor 2 [Alphaproteobacteria bacterium]